MSLNPSDNNLFKRLYTIIKNKYNNLSDNILLKIQTNIFNNKLENNPYISSDFYIIILFIYMIKIKMIIIVKY